MAKRDVAKKFVLNYFVMGGTGLPNLAINGGTQLVLDVWFRWSGVMAVFAYFVGLFLSMTYSNVFSMLTKSEFQFLRWHYSFSHKPNAPKQLTAESKDSD